MSPKTQMRRDEMKLPPMETILTRHKSSQQKRQLRNKDRSMKSITQLLKSPTRSRKPKHSHKVQRSPTKKKQDSSSPSIKPEKKMENQDQYSLKKVKRIAKPEKVWLKPKHEMKMVAKTNKRKLCIPHRELKSPPKPSSTAEDAVYSELSMAELIRLVEETGSLDDEDLMEILTCPSPVWWEEPPQPWYTEDAILTRSENETQLEEILESETKVNELKKPPNILNKSKDVTFMRKRRKLENVLGNLRNKINHIISDEEAENEINLSRDFKTLTKDKSLSNSEIINDDSKMTTGENELRNDIKSNYIKNLNEERSVSDFNVTNVDFMTMDNNEESVFDPSLCDDKMLRDLENIDIPIEKDNRNPLNKKIEEDILKSEDDDIENYLQSSVIVKQNNLVPKALPPLRRFPKINKVMSPVSNKSFDFDSAEKEMDTISDTNIKFLTDDEVEKGESNSENNELDETSQIILDKIKQFFNKDKKAKNIVPEQSKDKKEYITVYKIVSDENDIELNDGKLNDNVDKSKINSFYKKCKNVRRKKEYTEEKKKSMTSDSHENNLDGKSLLVPNSENIKYCFKCSSIFETKYCMYCNKKSDEESPPAKRVCDKTHCDKSHADVKAYACDKCNFLTNSKLELRGHFLHCDGITERDRK